MSQSLFHREERLRSDYQREIGQNLTHERKEKFKKKNRNRTTLPRHFLGALLKKLQETMDTSGMDELGLNIRIGRIPNFNKMQEWKRVVENFIAASSVTETTSIAAETTPSAATSSSSVSEPTSRVETTSSVAVSSTSLQNSISQNDRDRDDDYRIVTTTLRQIIRDEHNLADIEQQLASEQRNNHQVFEAFSHVIREVTDMVYKIFARL